jgi:hypothetical protein
MVAVSFVGKEKLQWLLTSELFAAIILSVFDKPLQFFKYNHIKQKITDYDLTGCALKS